MSKLDKRKVNKIIHSLGLKYNLSDEKIKQIVESPYEFMHKTISNLNLEDIETEEEFEKIKTNFLFPSFMKLVINYSSLETRNKRRKNINNKINKKWENKK